MEKSSKTTPAKQQPEQPAKSEVANAGASDKTKKANFKPPVKKAAAERSKRLKWWPWVVLLPIWTYAAFLLAQALVLGFSWVFAQTGGGISGINPALAITVLTSLIYVAAVAIAVLVPYKLLNRRTTKVDLGLPDYPRWMDILLAVLLFVVYLVVSGIVVVAITNGLNLDLDSNQQLPFSQSMLTEPWQYWLAFTTLVVVAPLAEELLFRGYLYGKLRKTAPIWLAVLVTSLTFGLAHLWAPGSPLQIMVAIDTFVLSIFLCALRENTGAIWASFLLHAIKNGVAFYFLFVNPDIIQNIQASVTMLF